MNAPPRHAVASEYVFDGEILRRDHAVIVEGGEIAGIAPRGDLPPDMALQALPARTWLAPGFIDLQVNGGGDVLFNDDPTPDGIAAILAGHRQFGTTSLLPTLISDTRDRMQAALRAVQAAMTDQPGVLGIHLEGPFLSPARPGVHDPSMIRRPEPEDLELLTSARAGVTLVTLAPEEVPSGFVRRLAEAGIRVSLGHSMATYDQTRAALADGLTGFTHLFNAMRPLGARDPGPVAAALESHDACFGMIVDGHHVDPAMLRLALRGYARPMLVTDAMPPTGGSRPGFTLYGNEITLHDGRLTRHDGTLAGAALDMATAVRNAVRLLGMSLEDALRAASTAPAEFLGLGGRLGRLAPGHRADMVAFAPDTVEVLETWVSGRPNSAA